MQKSLYVAGIIIRDKKVLLLQRLQDDLEGGKWTPVNGSIESGETPEEAVVREVQEEVGLKFAITQRLDEGILVAFLGDAEGEVIPEPIEVADFGWFSYDELQSLQFAWEYKKLIERVLSKI